MPASRQPSGCSTQVWLARTVNAISWSRQARAAALDATDDGRVVVAVHLDVAALQAGIDELSELADPLCLIQHVALVADGPEVIGQQRLQGVGVGAQLGLVEGPVESVDIGGHQ